MIEHMVAFSSIVLVLMPSTISFLIGMAITPIVSHYLYKYKAWKKTPGKVAYDGNVAEEFNRLHNRNEVRAPRMGGIVVWASVLLTISLLGILASLIPNAAWLELDFLSRNQTWIPLAALIVGAFAGFVDDFLVIQPNGRGLKLSIRLSIVCILSAFLGWWFFAKLEVVSV
ncbi:MAG: phospho-N-acetylmuramoyl-pentapeptide-transferase, phospho-N-acetylmuramoyl-pentapeptide-transferase, partial [Candidatus Parcubacteria bacterium]